MFPAYSGGGGRGGGGRGGGGNRQFDRRGGGGGGQRNWGGGDGGGGGGYMIDRGGGDNYRGQGHGHHYHQRGGGRHSDHGGGYNRGGGQRGGYQDEVVDIQSSDDDNQVEDAVERGHGQERKRHRDRSEDERGHGHSKKKRKRSRSRSRSREDRGRGYHEGRRDRERGGSRWDNNRQGGGGYQQHQQQNYGGHGGRQAGTSNWNSAGPPPGLMGMNPWALDNNPFDGGPPPPNFQGRGGYHHQGGQGRGDYGRGYDDRGGRGGPPPPRGDYDDRVIRESGRPSRFSRDDQEQRRMQAMQNPRKVFLEEVNLNSEHAFRLDANSNPGLINFRSIAMSQKSTYDGGMGKGILGASEEEISQCYSKFHSIRCKLPEDVSSSSSSSEDELPEEGASEQEKTEKKKKRESLAKNYIGFVGKDGEPGNNEHLRDDFDSYSFDRKDGEKSIKERVEYYNREVRNQPENIQLWKEFVQFQDKVFEESDQIFGGEDNQKRSKKKSNRKALLEKKVAILDKALESNPKNLPLHLYRLELLQELYKSQRVLTEWKKLVTQHSQSSAFWLEYLLFSSSNLLIYKVSETVSLFDTCFQKFRLMMNPQYPEFQRPQKFPLFIADITFGLSLLLKSSGFMERAIAQHQAQLEFDFNCPLNLFKDKTLLNWKEESGHFEQFWDLGTPHFGEPGAIGWKLSLEKGDTEEEEEPVTISVSDKLISDFEEDTFDTLNEKMKDQGENNQENFDVRTKHQPNIWLNMESCRSKLYWLPWRKLCSDVEDCEDAQRVVNADSIVNFICPVPTSDIGFVSEFDRQAAYFRHVVNFLLTLREDFTPHTQTVDLVLSPFRGITLTESSSLFEEIYFWKRLADLYVSEPEVKAHHHVFAPEGFKLLDLVGPNLTRAEVLKPALFDITMKGTGLEDDLEMDQKRREILKENDTKFMEMFQEVLSRALEVLEPEWSSVLFEMWLRFEQKLTCGREKGGSKQRIKLAKGLMQHEKLRNCVGGYREIAMLEYFGGDLKKAVDLLGKTINVTGKAMKLEEEEVDWNRDWKGLTDLVALYRQLAELWLKSGEEGDEQKAYFVLVQLGCGFGSVEGMDEIGAGWKPKTNELLKATRGFERVMEMLVPKKEENEEEDGGDGEVVDKEIYRKWGGGQCVEYLLQRRCLITEWTQSFALFQFFGKGFEAASGVFEGVLGRLSSEGLSRRDNYSEELIRVHIREQLYISWCNLAARCLSKDPLMNSRFRGILGKALEEFPSSPPLLLLFTDVENQTSVAGKLWRLMMANMKPDSEKVITHWAPLIMGIGLARKIEELEHDEEEGLPVFGLGGPAVPQDTIFYKLDSMISVALQHPGARHCPLLWRVYLKLLALRAREGKDVQRARSAFYEAVRHCPSSKAVYLDGITYFPDMLKEVNELLAEKQLLIRLPLEELDVLLEMDEEGQAGKEKVEDEEEEVEEEEEEIQEETSFQKKRKSRESRSEGELGDSD